MNDETIDPPVTSRSPEPFSIGPELRQLAASGGVLARILLAYALLLLSVVGLFGLVGFFAEAPAYD